MSGGFVVLHVYLTASLTSRRLGILPRSLSTGAGGNVVQGAVINGLVRFSRSSKCSLHLELMAEALLSSVDPSLLWRGVGPVMMVRRWLLWRWRSRGCRVSLQAVESPLLCFSTRCSWGCVWLLGRQPSTPGSIFALWLTAGHSHGRESFSFCRRWDA